jgi:hypothetical protein
MRIFGKAAVKIAEGGVLTVVKNAEEITSAVVGDEVSETGAGLFER